MEIKTVAEFYAEVLDPLKEQQLTLKGAQVSWDGTVLSFDSQPSITVLPGAFHIRDVRVDGMTIQDWNQRANGG